METRSLDPYEQELFKVFDRHDHENQGSLDCEGLSQLCDTLQLQDKYENLSKTLLLDKNTNRVTFAEFKDALLRILGTMQDKSNQSDLDVSPEREVAPKYVSGTKKYGRRSRPRIEDPNLSPVNTVNSIQRSNSTRECVNGKKIYEIKRCTSVPSIPDLQNDDENDDENDENDENVFIDDDVCTEDMLREAWRKLGVGDDGFLNRSELNLVCEAIGLNKLADSVIRQLSTSNKVLDYQRISFQELLEALQQDETWNEFLNTTNTTSANNQTPFNTSNKENIIANSQSSKIQCIKLGPDGTGYVNSETLAELWENAGILAPKMLLKDLGFTNNNVDVQKLSMVLESEIKGLMELRVNHTCNPSVALLQAFITLYQCEIKCLKTVLQQICDEKEKLKYDISEANNRSALLAQEVDENVAKLEEKTQTQIRLLEMRHAELAKELTKQCSQEKELLAISNQKLEDKIKSMSFHEEGIKNELSTIRDYLKSIEKENQELNNKILDLEQEKCVLEKCIEDDRLKAIEAEKLANDELKRKVAIMEVLQRDNDELKDKNDEMISQIESLNREIVNCKLRPGSDCEIYVPLEGSIGYVTNKRRSDESSSEDFEFDSAISGSPRLGKIRKFQEQEQKDCTDSTNFTHRGFPAEKIATLNELLGLNPDCTSTDSDDHENVYIKALENIIKELTATLKTENSTEKYAEIMRQISEKNVSNVESKESQEMIKLRTKCTELEEALTLIKKEYDDCEDYWQNKLEEERNIFESEHIQSTEKLNEVLCKLTDYEEQYLKENQKGLSPIEETECLEKQYTDLETEYEELREYMQRELDDKQSLINNLQREITMTKSTKSDDNKIDKGTQSDAILYSKLSAHILENTNLYPSEMTPFNSDDASNSQWPSSLLQPHNKREDLQLLTPLASTLNRDSPVTMPIKQKKNRQRIRALNRNMTKQNEVQSDSSDSNETNRNNNNETKMLTNEVQSLKAKIEYLQLRCKRLQQRLREQQRYDEQLFQHYWYIHNAEKAELEQYAKVCGENLQQHMRYVQELQEKLGRGDMLVKDLYVENSYLITQNQRLDQQLKLIANGARNGGGAGLMNAVNFA